MLRVLIVDDEPAARRKTRRFLEEYGDIEIAGEASGGADAIQSILTLRPGLVFLDIQMPEVDGFDVVEALSRAEHVPQIVFVTAHDEFAVRAFEVNALDYLLKPFDRERFATTLERCRAAASKNAHGNQLMDLLASLRTEGRYMRRLLLSKEGRSKFVPVASIRQFEAERNNVIVHTGNETYTVRMTLEALEQRLDPEQFARVHRSHVINLDAVAEIAPWFHGDHKITLGDGSVITWSRRYAAKRPDLLRV